MANRRCIKTGLWVSILALALDQASKWYLLTQTDLPYFSPISITPFFDLVMVWNKGVSFGMFAAHDQPYILVGLSVVIVLILLRWLYTTSSRWTAMALGLVIGGAVGNVIDRLRLGAVADFFDFYIGNAHWPAFNIADSTIFIGVVILCGQSMFNGRKQR